MIALLTHLADRPAFALSTLDPCLPAEEGSMASLLQLSSLLPRGLIHADALWFVVDPPKVEPLAPGSPWFAIEHSLAVVGEDLEERLNSLLRYRKQALWIKKKLRGEADLELALAADVIPAEKATQIADALGMTFSELTALDSVAPGLRQDIASMVRRDFDPELRIHPRLRPSWLEAEGQRMAKQLLEAQPGRFNLLVCDHAMALEPLSPYASDVGSALYQWAQENPEALKVPGLLDAVEASQQTPERLWASVVAIQLANTAPETIAERRAAEASQGLLLEDGPVLTAGWCDLGVAAAADRTALATEEPGRLVVVVGPPQALAGAVYALVDSARVERFAAVLAARNVPGGVGIVESVVGPDDGIRLPESSVLSAAAADLDVRAQRISRCELGVHLPVAAGKILGHHRRAWVDGKLDADSPCFLTTYGTSAAVSDRNVFSSILHAVRVSLASLVGSRYRPATDPPVGSRRGNPMRARFRA